MAFRCLEYDGIIPEDELKVAWKEIESAIRNLFDLSLVAEAMKGANLLLAQPTLQFRHSGMNVVAKPDLVAFAQEVSPLILDWKVRTFGV